MEIVVVLCSIVASHGRGLGPRDALRKDSRGLCRGVAGNPRFPRLLPGTLGKDGEALYSQQKQDQELTVAQQSLTFTTH